MGDEKRVGCRGARSEPTGRATHAHAIRRAARRVPIICSLCHFAFCEDGLAKMVEVSLDPFWVVRTFAKLFSSLPCNSRTTSRPITRLSVRVPTGCGYFDNAYVLRINTNKALQFATVSDGVKDTEDST